MRGGEGPKVTFLATRTSPPAHLPVHYKYRIMQLMPLPTMTVREATEAGDELVDAVLGASRALVAVAARSLVNVAEDVTLAQYRVLVELAARGPSAWPTWPTPCASTPPL